MQGTTGRRKKQLVSLALHGLVVLSVLGLALLGQAPVEVAGWIIQPTVYAERWERKQQRGSGNWLQSLRVWLSAMGCYLVQSWQPVLLRSLLLWALWTENGARTGGVGRASPLVVLGVAGFGRGLARLTSIGGVGRDRASALAGTTSVAGGGCGMGVGALATKNRGAWLVAGTMLRGV